MYKIISTFGEVGELGLTMAGLYLKFVVCLGEAGEYFLSKQDLKRTMPTPIMRASKANAGKPANHVW